ncbi:protein STRICTOSIDINE SYNTHASE-LIKE 2-like [Rhodamnia argentea]|uniref:Protein STRICTOSIDINE SYNTHASE-LIKE 2-like n=1 Tax=Rhodamnia argentea TaxID=178133 RepID=A0A8B8N8N9_9MYRT|nr:protein STRICTOSIDINE SYNTHASE-LIKE 2-like [Rhodamnia argentea]
MNSNHKLSFFVAATAVVSVLFTVYLRAPSSEPGTVDGLELVPMDRGAVGPESFAFDPQGEGPYTGVSDGRVVKWAATERRWVDFAFTSPSRDVCEKPHEHREMEHVCGRPLGLGFDPRTSHLYIADAYMGLLAVGPAGGLATAVAAQADGVSFRFTNGLDIDPLSGAVYFTDSSSQYQRRNYIPLILSGDRTGRLMKYDPESNRVTTILNNLSFPNGVALNDDGDFVLVAETSTCRVLKYWLRPPHKEGKVEVFARLPGFPDNIRRSPRGGYWVGIFSRRNKVFELVLSSSWMGKFLLGLPIDAMKIHGLYASWRGKGMGVRLSEEGEVVEILEERVGNQWRSISEVEERDGGFLIGSVNMPFAGYYKAQEI